MLQKLIHAEGLFFANGDMLLSKNPVSFTVL
jgi:hypothetical protein